MNLSLPKPLFPFRSVARLLDLIKDKKAGSVVRADLKGKNGEEISTNKPSEILKQMDNGANLMALSLLITLSIPIIITLFASGRVSLPSTIPSELRTQALKFVLKRAVKSISE